MGALNGAPVGRNPLKYLDDKFTGYIADRRREPRDDVLGGMATATYPDGSTPELLEVVRPATFLFAAGQETVTKLLSSAVQTLGRTTLSFNNCFATNRRLISRLHRGITADAEPDQGRLPSRPQDHNAWRRTYSGRHRASCCASAPPTETRASSRIPHEFRLDRKNVREHIAFGRGIHTCAGAPLARVEGRVTVHRLLDRMRDITISEDAHGPADDRRYSYEPTFLLRGLTELHIEFTPVR